MGLGIPPLKIKNLTEYEPGDSRFSFCGLAVHPRAARSTPAPFEQTMQVAVAGAILSEALSPTEFVDLFWPV